MKEVLVDGRELVLEDEIEEVDRLLVGRRRRGGYSAA
jgi:hypothetical protein